MMYGMQKTTVYLPHELKRALTRLAAQRGQSEADLVREALETLTASEGPPAPRLPLFRSGKPSLAERVDERLKGFGRR
jgi:Arc/MetJ-type ribon-helix-helix transcriptional regulator